MVIGIACYVFFIVGFPNHMGQGYAMILTLFGLVLLMLGPAAMEYLFFPIAYLVFGVTISQKIMNDYITFRLQHLAAEGGYALLNIVGVHTDIKGNILQVTNGMGVTRPLEIAKACSGMSMLIAFVALGAAMALVACRHWWQRVVLVMMAAPVALLLNVIRIAVLGVATLFDEHLAEGEAHMMIGNLLLVPGFFLYLFIVWSLNKAVEGGGASAPGRGGVGA
jgi:exosortase